MLYSCTHVVPLDVKGLNLINHMLLIMVTDMQQVFIILTDSVVDAKMMHFFSCG